MEYSPKLKIAAEEIKAILLKHDIAAIVALHTPGFGETLMSLTPSYSAILFEPAGIRLRAKAEDFGGDEKARDLQVANTANMLALLTDMLGKLFLKTDILSERVDEITGAEHNNGSESSHTSQNN